MPEPLLHYRTQQVIGRLRIERSADCTVVIVVPRLSGILAILWPLLLHSGWLGLIILSNTKLITRPEPTTFVLGGIAATFALLQILGAVVAHLNPQRWEIRQDGITESHRTITKIVREQIPRSIVMYAAVERIRDAVWPTPYEAVVLHFIHGVRHIVFAGTKEEKAAFINELIDRLDCPEPAIVKLFPPDPCAADRVRVILPDGFAFSVYPTTFR